MERVRGWDQMCRKWAKFIKLKVSLTPSPSFNLINFPHFLQISKGVFLDRHLDDDQGSIFKHMIINRRFRAKPSLYCLIIVLTWLRVNRIGESHPRFKVHTIRVRVHTEIIVFLTHRNFRSQRFFSLPLTHRSQPGQRYLWMTVSSWIPLFLRYTFGTEEVITKYHSSIHNILILDMTASNFVRRSHA